MVVVREFGLKIKKSTNICPQIWVFEDILTNLSEIWVFYYFLGRLLPNNAHMSMPHSKERVVAKFTPSFR